MYLFLIKSFVVSHNVFRLNMFFERKHCNIDFFVLTIYAQPTVPVESSLQNDGNYIMQYFFGCVKCT